MEYQEVLGMWLQAQGSDEHITPAVGGLGGLGLLLGLGWLISLCIPDKKDKK